MGGKGWADARTVVLMALLVLALLLLGLKLHADSRSADAVPRDLNDPAYPDCRRFPASPLATRYLENLHGIEIGASMQNSFGLKRSINVDFSDDQGGRWQSAGCPPAIVNLVALGDDLPFKDATLDYVLSSHVIEHFFDPVKALREWHRVVRPGGYIFIIAPHRDRTADKDRDVTPLAELLDRASGKIGITNYARPVNPTPAGKAGESRMAPLNELQHQVLVRDKSARQLEPGWEFYQEDDHHHWSVWRTQDFVRLVQSLGYPIAEVQDRDDKVGNGFTVVIRKR